MTDWMLILLISTLSRWPAVASVLPAVLAILLLEHRYETGYETWYGIGLTFSTASNGAAFGPLFLFNV